MNQYYDAEIIKEYVMKGNSAIIKCSIPSFVADFVSVIGWTDEEGKEYFAQSSVKDGIRHCAEPVDLIQYLQYPHQLFVLFFCSLQTVISYHFSY